MPGIYCRYGCVHELAENVIEKCTTEVNRLHTLQSHLGSLHKNLNQYANVSATQTCIVAQAELQL